MEKDALIVLSGGMDSVTLLYDYKDSIALAVNFIYGSNHNMRELACARLHCQALGIELLEIHLDFMGEYFHSSLLEGGDAIPEGNYEDDNMRSTVVPFRNGIMLATAAGLAESRGLSAVMLANHSGDHSIYPDCRPEFIDAMAHAIAAGTYEAIELRAPYTNLTKAQIAMRGRDLGIDYSTTYSCYKGGEHHCGVCGTCRERRESLAEAGIQDTTIYVDDFAKE
ncbi:MAG: 7-cyano-7-deazaguanine synthase QueC [Bacteroidales bacterium]|nr:7-cyano-7-deazaguanine synthase QueC [Bacteroidales bacterium]MBD5294302.1 7-cyano-7-deazaguanine synthase QueC [Bacteroides sp.]MBD5351413.1 7-cyano-7-deazaguanine synthase QueC [Bacteroides sp.]MBD5360137.1 7-cyano-7-deazaguanine synthase QueC [Bacteroides sp.]MBD5361592.1 7-cyano-7-deazaguanine synthase QueC [Bacteroides sp.]